MSSGKFSLRYNNWNVYMDNAIFIGTASVDIGEITHAGVEVSGSGIAGTVNIPAKGQVPSFQITLHHHVCNEDTFALLDGHKHTLEIRAMADTWDRVEGDSGAAYQSIFCSVFHSGLSMGSIAPNTDAGATTTHEVVYIRIDEDGRTVYELDKFAQVEKVLINGTLVDQLAEMRNNL